MDGYPEDCSGTTRQVLVSRQAIYTPQLEVMAYTLCFPSEADASGDGEHDYRTLLQGILTSFLDIGLEDFTENKPAFLPCTRGLVLMGTVTVFPPARVVLALPATYWGDGELCAALSELAARGYAIALADDLVHDPMLPYAEHAAFLTLDVSAMDRPALQQRVTCLRQYPLPLVALHVQTWDDFRYCRDLGFAYFHGAFLCQPDVRHSQRLPTHRLALLDVLAKLQDPLVTVDTITELISRDVALSYRLLHAINTAWYGQSRPVHSLQQAVRLLGLTAITRWTSMLLLTDIHDKPSELMTIAMVRAKMCEWLAHVLGPEHTASAFLVGLLSVLDALLDRPMPELLQRLPLAAALHWALVEHAGDLGAILHSVLAYEQGKWEEAIALGLDQDLIVDAYLRAIAWAVATRETLGWV